MMTYKLKQKAENFLRLPKLIVLLGFLLLGNLALIFLTPKAVYASQDRFGGVFQKGSDPHNLLSGLSWNKLSSKMTELGSRNQKLVDVEIIQRQSTDPERGCEPPTFAGVWREGNYAQDLIGGLNWHDFKQQIKTERKKGMKLVDIETHFECGIRKYVGVFSKDLSHQRWRRGRSGRPERIISSPQIVRTNMSWENLSKIFSLLHKANWHLVDIETYKDNGQRFWIGVWDKGHKEEWLWSMPREKFETFQKYGEGPKQKLVDMESWRDEGERQMAGIFYGSSDPAILETGKNWNKFLTLWNYFSGKQNRLVDLEVYPDTTDRRWENTFAHALNGKAMGWSFAVFESGDLAEAGAHGWARSPYETSNPSVPMTPELAMNVASVTKLITVVGILKINEEMGGNFLDMPFAYYLSGSYDTSTFGNGVNTVTIRNLMTQKTGMKEPGDAEFKSLGNNYHERIGNWLQISLIGTPGVGPATYYNHYFNLLLLVIEAVKGQDYEQWMNTNIFYPLGIGPLACAPATYSSDPLYYKQLPDHGQGQILSYPGDNCFDGPNGMGGAWYASPIDMAKFIAAFRDGSILTPASVHMMEDEVMAWYWHNNPYYPGVLGQKNGGLTWNDRGMATDVMALVDQFDVALIFNSHLENVSAEKLILSAYHAPEDW